MLACGQTSNVFPVFVIIPAVFDGARYKTPVLYPNVSPLMVFESDPTDSRFKPLTVLDVLTVGLVCVSMVSFERFK